MSTATAKATMQGERELVVTRTFDAPRHLVYKAWTEPKYVKQWMLGPEGWSMPVCEVDLRPGGAWHFVWRHNDGQEMEMHGVYKEVNPPERVVSTESWGGPWPETVNTLVFTEKDGKTTMTLTILYVSKEARDEALKTGMTKGMELSFQRLEKVLASEV